MDRKLKIELIPDGCFKFNLRNLCSKELWDFFKSDAKKRAGGKCAICGKNTKFLDAHEQWDYQIKNKKIVLKNIIAVCKDCHNAIHMNRTAVAGNLKKAEDHYMKVNGVSYVQMKQDLNEANELQKRRSQVDDWIMDLSFIENTYKSDGQRK